MSQTDPRKVDIVAEELEKDVNPIPEAAEAENTDEAFPEMEDDTEVTEEAAEGTEETAEASEETKEEPKEKKGFFQKKKDKRDEQIEELNDKLLRQMAEFNNFRNRTDKEKAQRFDMGAKSVIEKMLPIVDNFERGLQTVPEEQKEDPFVVGMDKVYKQLIAQLEAMDVKPIECVGKEFDPELHNAVMQVPSEELESGIVAQEFQKGYTYKDSVVRHSMVAVVQ